jgi:hypothetical protein
VTQPVTVRSLESAKCWSEWQDLNLRPPRPERGARRVGPKIRLAPSHVMHLLGPAGSRTTRQMRATHRHDRLSYRPLLRLCSEKRGGLTDAAVGYDQISGAHPVDDPRPGPWNPSGTRCVPFCVPCCCAVLSVGIATLIQRPMDKSNFGPETWPSG